MRRITSFERSISRAATLASGAETDVRIARRLPADPDRCDGLGVAEGREPSKVIARHLHDRDVAIGPGHHVPLP